MKGKCTEVAARTTPPLSPPLPLLPPDSLPFAWLYPVPAMWRLLPPLLYKSLSLALCFSCTLVDSHFLTSSCFQSCAVRAPASSTQWDHRSPSISQRDQSGSDENQLVLPRFPAQAHRPVLPFDPRNCRTGAAYPRALRRSGKKASAQTCSPTKLNLRTFRPSPSLPASSNDANKHGTYS